MIGSEYQIVDLGEAVDVKTLPIYTTHSSLKIINKPDWLNVSSYEENVVIPITDGKVILNLTATEGRFDPIYNDSLIFSDTAESETLEISVLWSFNPKQVSLKYVADSLVDVDFQDTALENLHRLKILKKLKEGLTHLGFTGNRTVERFETTSDDNSMIYAPIDMVSPVKVYAVDSEGRLGLMYQDNRLNAGSASPLRDEDNGIILDNNSVWLEGSGLTPTPPAKTDMYEYGSWCNDIEGFNYDGYGTGLWTSVKGFAGGVKSFFGQYKYVEALRGWKIQDSPFENFVIEYVSDPNIKANLKRDYGQIRIHTDWVEALKSWTYYELIKWRSDVPQSEKERSRREMGLSRKVAKRLSLNWTELIQALKSQRNINKF